MDVCLNVFNIKINSMETSAAFTIGTNLLVGFQGCSKTSNGTSSITGDYASSVAYSSSVDDRDSLDMPRWEGRPMASAFGPAPSAPPVPSGALSPIGGA